jgi:RNA polymerase-binding transcription factor DksA
MDKINSESLEYSKEGNERQMSKTIEGMFTLGENGFGYCSNGGDSITEQRYSNEKNT